MRISRRHVVTMIISMTALQFLSGQECKRQGAFVANLGFDVYKSALSSSEEKQIGVLLIELEDPKSVNSKRIRTFQDSSWRIVGYAGAITTDELGNSFIAPKANVNNYYNPPLKQNTLFIINSRTGKMSEFVSIPMTQIPNEKNPFGILGSYFDCDSKSILISTIAGSDEHTERGQVCLINRESKQIKILLDSIDVLGLSIIKIANKRHLMYGLCRSSKVYTQEINTDNVLVGQAKLAIDMQGLGPREDDKCRKIRQRPDGSIEIYGVPFFYNLTAPTIKQESYYVYKLESDGWRLVIGK